MKFKLLKSLILNGGLTFVLLASLQAKAISDVTVEQLNTAYEISSMIPVQPHIKSRSRRQLDVVRAALELKQPELAEVYIQDVANWRKGLAYAELAFFYASEGETEDVPDYLERADGISRVASQDWRRDRVRVRIAQVYAMLGDLDQVAAFSKDIAEPEQGKFEQEANATSFEETMESLNTLVVSGVYDAVRNAMFAYANLYKFNFNDPTKRELLEKTIKDSYGKIPLLDRVEILCALSANALDYGEQATALRFLSEARQMIQDANLQLEYRLPIESRLGALQYHCGEKKEALSNLSNLCDLYRSRGHEIINIFRTESLLPLAEAYSAVGKKDHASKIYAWAVDASVENVNSCPRAEDLSAICVSMALNEFEPDAMLWSEINTHKSQLGTPW